MERYTVGRIRSGKALTNSLHPYPLGHCQNFVLNSGATTSFAVRGELVFNHRKYFKTKNVYWNYREDTAKIVWQDNDTVIINGHTLNIPEDTYDFRREIDKERNKKLLPVTIIM
ncbi:DUF5412 family protein [Bacillus cereus]|uniref:DUF5412 family protein n=1 Tax=Bacillus cereus TaxID=1396 RepID=UPI0020D26855|nr:DUF5412 family protein [Bacillus cereus]